ncbi:MAG: 5'-methylthioadenosine/adenosylhomocysteine nucleosidase [Lachnospiraceae bacterium]|nr:5'-methylthioadenosine/adenosylhomocysteine nucleosidase [Lachnospiraceae bacterium]
MAIGIVGAMDVEVAIIREAMKDPQVTTVAGMDFYSGTIAGRDVILVKCGIGKINAALCVQILADRFGVEAVINEGIAGALDPELEIGDFVVSKTAIQHDVDLRIFGYPLGMLGSNAPREWTADPVLGEKIMNYLSSQEDATRKVKYGRIVSGDQFIADDEKKAFLVSEFEGTCAEMEGAAIAHAATLNKIPFVILRAISDKADGSGNVDYPTFEKKMAHFMGHTMVEMLGKGVF